MTEYSYAVTHLTGGTTVITTDVEELEMVNTGSGEVKSAKLTLNAVSGKFLTSAPVLAQFDKIQINITDEDATTFYQVFEVDRIIPIKNAGEGYKVEVELLSQEHHLQKVDIAKQYEKASATTVTKDIIDFANDIMGTSQPTVSQHDTFTSGNNELPQWTANDYEFGTSEVKAYDALMEVVEGLGASVAAGGAGDFYELWFDSKASNTLDFKAFVSGSDPAGGSEVTITDSTAVNVAPTEGGIDALTGTVVKAWGDKSAGTLPNSVQDFNSELEAFLLIPDWISGVTYPVGARVHYNGTKYEANTETTNTPGHADWTVKDFDDIQGAANGYSLWTESKADEWESSMADPSATFGGRAAFDSNLQIEDGTYHQEWVYQRVYTSVVGAGTGQFHSNNLYSGTDAYRGFKVLVDPSLGTIGGVFAENSGNDRFGKAYSKNIVKHNGGTAGTYLDWDVVRETADNERVAERFSGKVFKRESGTWSDASSDDKANHCFHPTQGVSNTSGYNSTSDGTGTYGDNSAVEWHYQWTSTAGAKLGASYYKAGAWACFSLPFPENSYNFNTIGELYGNNTTKLEPVTLDANNMHLTHSGNVGFNNSEAEDLGVLDGIQCDMKFKWTDPLGAIVFAGNFKFRCTLYDTEGNTVVQDFVIPFNNLWQSIRLPFSGFTNYRARIPHSLGQTATLFTKELEVLNVFQWRNIKMISFQWQDQYDEEGRFDPDNGWWNNLTDFGTHNTYLAIDAFAFTKPLLAVTSPVTDRCIEPRSMNYPDITNAIQLGQIVNSQLDIEQFQHKEYTITTPGKCDIAFGDTFFLTDSTMINDADTRTADSGGSANTVRLVAKRITYKIDKENGFTRTILGIKRLLT